MAFQNSETAEPTDINSGKGDYVRASTSHAKRQSGPHMGECCPDGVKYGADSTVQAKFHTHKIMGGVRDP